MGELKFESAIKRLEEIVEELEKENVSLEDALKKYEEAVKLIEFCSKKLEEVERKINILVRTEDGKLEKRPFEEEVEE